MVLKRSFPKAENKKIISFSVLLSVCAARCAAYAPCLCTALTGLRKGLVSCVCMRLRFSNDLNGNWFGFLTEKTVQGFYAFFKVAGSGCPMGLSFSRDGTEDVSLGIRSADVG